MPKIRIMSFEALRQGSADLATESASDNVATDELFVSPKDPIHARLHHVPEGGHVRWEKSTAGYLCYVWEGAALVGDNRMARGSMIAVEHGATCEARADAGGATLLVFNRSPSAAKPGRAGGHVHLLPADYVPRSDRVTKAANVGAAIFADSACPTCELWLHESMFFDAGFEVAPHMHTEDEIIVVTEGEIVLGTRSYGRGTAIAIDKNTVYRFRTGDHGLRFINFRPCHPTYATPDRSLIIDEQALYLKKLGRPEYLAIA